MTDGRTSNETDSEKKLLTFSCLIDTKQQPWRFQSIRQHDNEILLKCANDQT
jgi:hypothetical protein